MIIAVDPGKNTIAWAAFTNQSLIAAGIKTDGLVSWVAERAGIFSRVIIERPQIYPQSKGDPNDLIDVAITVGLCLTLSQFSTIYRPREWKGQVPKKIHNARALDKLRPGERHILGELVKNHNVIDAIGIGLYYLGR